MANDIGLKLIGMIPYDNSLRSADLNGEAPIDFAPGSPAIEEIERIEKYLLNLIESDKK